MSTSYHAPRALTLVFLGLLLALPGCGAAGAGAPAANAAPAVVVATPSAEVATVAPATSTTEPTATPLPTQTVPPTSTPFPTATPPPPTPDLSQDDLFPLSDEFEEPATLTTWQNHAEVEGWPSQIETLDINTTSPGHLYLLPYTSAWYADYRGVLLFKEITGDFMVTTRIRATGRKSDLPKRDYSFAGLMVRAPRDVTPESWKPNAENWLFITTGYGERSGGKPQLETKTTRNSDSRLILTPSRNEWVELRIVRLDDLFLMLYRFEGEAWQLSKQYVRPDLPATLQVGLNAYTDWQSVIARPLGAREFNPILMNGPETKPDLIVRSDYVRFRRPIVPATLQAAAEAGSLTVDELMTIGSVE